MRTLMINTNTYRTIAPAPIGASLVASRLRREGHEVRFLDLMFARDPVSTAAKVTREFDPELICFSIRNVDTQSSTSFFDPLPTINKIVGSVLQVTRAPTLLGGTAFTTFPAQFLEVLGADYGIAGDDPDPIASFVASLAAGQPDFSVPGLVYRAGGAIRLNPFVIRGYADTVFDGWDVLDLKSYRRSPSVFWDAGLVVRSGCPFKCIYCDTYRTFGSHWVLRDPLQVADEALTLQRLGARSIIFADAGFNRPLDHAKEILQALIRKKVRLNLTAIFEPGEADKEFAQLFHRAGGRCVALFAGSLADPVLSETHKPFVAEDVEFAAKLLRDAGVESFLFLIFGGPGETPATIETTFEAAQRIGPLMMLMDYGYRIQPGTGLRERAIAEGLVPADFDCFKPVFYFSPATPPERLRERLRRFEADNRWKQGRALSWMAKLMWRKYHP
ncbi:MAG: cobalamin-dependent protein [Dehalococcoidia bacterium]|nr:cobalamin-dependent protein [Dehalococcoidia bacterium]